MDARRPGSSVTSGATPAVADCGVRPPRGDRPTSRPRRRCVTPGDLAPGLRRRRVASTGGQRGCGTRAGIEIRSRLRGRRRRSGRTCRPAVARRRQRASESRRRRMCAGRRCRSSTVRCLCQRRCPRRRSRARVARPWPHATSKTVPPESEGTSPSSERTAVSCGPLPWATSSSYQDAISGQVDSVRGSLTSSILPFRPSRSVRASRLGGRVHAAVVVCSERPGGPPVVRFRVGVVTSTRLRPCGAPIRNASSAPVWCLERPVVPVADHEPVVVAVEAHHRSQPDVAGHAELVPETTSTQLDRLATKEF